MGKTSEHVLKGPEGGVRGRPKYRWTDDIKK